MILVVNLGGLGLSLVFLGAKRGRDQRSRRLTDLSRSPVAWRDTEPVFDAAWPEIGFDMDVMTTRFDGGLCLFLALFLGVLAGISPNSASNIVVSIILDAFPIVLLILGCVMFLSSLPRWQSHIVLEAERLVVYPTFKRSPRAINYEQIYEVGFGEQRFTRLTGAIIYYYPLDYGGHVDVTRMRKMGLPSTSQNEGLRLVLQARLAGQLPDPELASTFFAKRFIGPLIPFIILLGIGQLAIALQPESRERILLVPLGLVEIGLLLTEIVMIWPVRRK